ncbi:MAG TPA: hypothetical protein VFK41_12275 [Nocardioidaceae bacterium]|nr:hypothetical protein [Nocardioidaceae bacterium]
MSPDRVRVTHPRTAGARPRPRTARSEIDAQSELGAVYMSSLLRTQGRLAAAVLLVVLLTLGSLPLLFELFPGLRELSVAGMPLPWVLLALVVYPFLVLLGWLYVRRAERNESAFTDVVGR